MTELVQLIQWAFGGFWRFCGFALLLAIVSGAASSLLGFITAALVGNKVRER